MKPNTPLTLSKAGLDLIKTSEKLRLTAYLCPANRLTIGWGHVLLPKFDAGLFSNVSPEALARIIKDCQSRRTVTKEAKALLYINQKQAEALLTSDASQTARFIRSITPVSLTQNQFDALCSLVFNIGQTNYAESTLRRTLKNGHYALAATEFDRWIYGTVDGKLQKLPGLITRRAAERALFEKTA
jgi:lysozyme